MSFVDVFGGSIVRPADVSYTSLTISTDKTLAWPDLFVNATTAVASSIIDLTATAASLSVTLPPANEVSVGQAILFNNIGSNSVTIKRNDGSTLTTISAGQVKYVYVTINSTAAGTWGVIGFGASTTSADSGVLAGFGLVSIGATLNLEWPYNEQLSNYTVQTTDRASLLAFTGGSATITLQSAPTYGTDFVFAIKNAGSGTLTINTSGTDTIDNLSTIQLSPDESTIIVTNGTNRFSTVGRGRATTFNFTQLVKAVSSGTVTLTAAEASNKLMQFTGAMTGNVNVVLPNTVNVYYVFNNTTGGFTLTLKTAAGSGTVVPQGGRVILVNDAVDVFNASTVIPSSSILFADGTTAAPSISFASDTDTGFYRSGSNQVSASMGATEVLRMMMTAVQFLQPITFVSSAVATTSRTNIGAASLDEALAFAISL